MSSNNSKNKIIKSFLYIGLNETKPQKYSIDSTIEEQSLRFISAIDIIQLPKKNVNTNRYDLQNQKWLRINNSNYFLRLEYTYNYVNPITEIKLYKATYLSNEYIIYPKKIYDLGFRPIKLTKTGNVKNIKDFPKIREEEKTFQKYDNNYIIISSEYDFRNYFDLPKQNNPIIILISRKTVFLPILDIICQKNSGEKSFPFKFQRHKSPYLYKYLPEVLDSYPKSEEQNQGISLFCFPEGVQILDHFETPKCFNFVLTDGMGERTFGSTLIFVQEVSIEMNSAFIPSYNEQNKTYFCQKAICILSNYPFNYNCLFFLKEIYNMAEPNSTTKIPIERAICTFVDSLYIQPYDKILRFNIYDKKIDFYRIANYGKLWDTNDKYLQTLFRVLSYQNIITLWQGLLLEKKIILLCNSKIILSHVAHALINLIFPFKWIHTYVPILPEKLKLFIDSPVPFIIGISFKINVDSLSNDFLVVNLNKNCFEKYVDVIPPLPQKFQKILMSKLNRLKEISNLDNPENLDKWIFQQEEAIIYLGPDTMLFPQIDTNEIRDAFYSVFIAMFKNYKKFFSWKKDSIDPFGTKTVFMKENFLREHNSLEDDSFLRLFSDTLIFSQFTDCFVVEENNIKSSFAFFIESINSGKGKNKYYLPNIIPKNVVLAQSIEISDLKGKIFNYQEFPILNSKLFILNEVPSVVKKSKFLYANDEWCHSAEKLKRNEWPNYFLYLIYDIWFTFFSFVLNIYEDDQSIIMMDYSLSLIEYLSSNLQITPTRNLFSKLIKSCTRTALNPYIKQLLLITKNINKGKSKFNALFHNDYLNGLYYLAENVGQTYLGASIADSRMLVNTMRNSIIEEMKKTDINIIPVLNNIIFIPYIICFNCLNKQSDIKIISYDEILAGFIMNKNGDNSTICPNCFAKFEPKIYYFNKNQEDLDIKDKELYSPMTLIQKIDQIIQKEGELCFYKEKEWTDIYWNIIFYFLLLDLPTCVLYVQNKMGKFEKLKNDLKNNIKRKLNKEKKVKKRNFFSYSILNKINNDTTSDSTSNNSKLTHIREISSISTKSGMNLISNNEIEIWSNYQQKNLDKIKKEIKIQELKKEEKNEILLRLKDTKFFFENIICDFNCSMQEKYEEFLDNYYKMEKMRENDFVNMHFKMANEKYINEQGKLKLTGKSNIIDDAFSINTRYDENINKISGKIPLDTIRKSEIDEKITYVKKKVEKPLTPNKPKNNIKITKDKKIINTEFDRKKTHGIYNNDKSFNPSNNIKLLDNTNKINDLRNNYYNAYNQDNQDNSRNIGTKYNAKTIQTFQHPKITFINTPPNQNNFI